MNWSSTTVATAIALCVGSAGVVLGAGGCAPRPRMCTAQTDCASPSACVAGRCQADQPNVKPAIDAARRLVVRPADLAYVRRGDGPSGGALPPLFALGTDGAVLFMRFAVALPAGANVVEAYVVLHRSEAVDDDPAPIALHGTRIVQGWDGRSTSWALQPRTQEMRLPATVVEPGGPVLVRMDVRDIVRQWPKRDSRDQGIAVVSGSETKTGTTFAFRAVGAERGPAPDVEPYLELYIRSTSDEASMKLEHEDEEEEIVREGCEDRRTGSVESSGRVLLDGRPSFTPLDPPPAGGGPYECLVGFPRFVAGNRRRR